MRSHEHTASNKINNCTTHSEIIVDEINQYHRAFTAREYKSEPRDVMSSVTSVTELRLLNIQKTECQSNSHTKVWKPRYKLGFVKILTLFYIHYLLKTLLHRELVQKAILMPFAVNLLSQAEIFIFIAFIFCNM